MFKWYIITAMVLALSAYTIAVFNLFLGIALSVFALYLMIHKLGITDEDSKLK